MRKSVSGLLLAVAFAVSVTACGGGGGSSGGGAPGGGNGEGPSTTSEAHTSLGPVYDGFVVAVQFEQLILTTPLKDQRELVLDSVLTDNKGIATGLDMGGYTGPVLYALFVDDATTYYDEAAGAETAVPAYLAPLGIGDGFIPEKFKDQFEDEGRDPASFRIAMLALADSPKNKVAITPLTTLALAVARNILDSVDSPSLIRRANGAIREALAPELTSILSPATPFDSGTTSGSLGATDADKYALKLAALAELNAAEPSPAALSLDALYHNIYTSMEIEDPYPFSDFESFVVALSAALDDYATDYGTPDLQDAVASYPGLSKDIGALYDALDDDGNLVLTAGTYTATIDGVKHVAEIEPLMLATYIPGQMIVIGALNQDTHFGAAASLMLDQGNSLRCQEHHTEHGAPLYQAALSVTTGVTTSDPHLYEARPGNPDSGEPAVGECQVDIITNEGPGGILEATFSGTLYHEDTGVPITLSQGRIKVTLPENASP
jgi:hypothetical protein